MNETERDIRMDNMEKKVNQIYQALIGSDLAKDGGLIKRVIDMEVEIETLRIKLEKQTQQDQKTELYVKIMWAMAGVIGSGLVGYIIHSLSK